MPTVQPRDLAEFLDRFLSFNDAVLRRVEHRFLSSGTQRCVVTLSAQDRESARGWSNVVVTVEQVSELTLREGKTSCQVLSDGVIIKWFEGVTFLVFSATASDPETVEEVRQSDFYVAGVSFAWEVGPFAEE
jgi:hypothetical protein